MTAVRSKSLLRAATILTTFGWGATESASASAAFVPMGDYARQAEIVALVDSRPSVERPNDSRAILTFREILKGGPGLAGREFLLARRHASSDAFAPQEGEGFAVLLREGWESHDLPLLTVYTEAHEIEALRALVEIDRLPTERERLLALCELLDAANLHFGQQLMQDFRNMRDERNFDLLTGLYEDADPGMRREATPRWSIRGARASPLSGRRRRRAPPSPSRTRFSRPASGPSTAGWRSRPSTGAS